MPFDFNFDPPDPEEINKVLGQMKFAFERAAEASTGKAQPLFQNLSDSFNKIAGKLEKISTGEQELSPVVLATQILPALMALEKSFQQLRGLAQRDSSVQDALVELQSDIQEATKPVMGKLLGGLGGGLGGFGGQDDDTSNDNDESPRRPPKRPPPRPKKPGNGNFNL